MPPDGITGIKTMPLLSITDLNCHDKQVLIRADLNVPMNQETITDDSRIIASLPTIQHVLDQGGSVVILSHLGQPKSEVFEHALSLKPVAKRLAALLNLNVTFVNEPDDLPTLAPGEVALIENTRFMSGEKSNDASLSQKLASLGDIFVMDAYATIHRAHASTEGVAAKAKKACTGLLLAKELKGIAKITQSQEHPTVAIVGGSKVSTKLKLLKSLIDQVDTLIVGGGIANTLLAAKGFNIGKSLFESEWIPQAKALLQEAEDKGTLIPLPTDVIASTAIDQPEHAAVFEIGKLPNDYAIFDIGPKMITQIHDIIIQAKTILWNGPVGVFEKPAYAKGTQAILESIALNKGYSLAGGGDTLAAIAQLGDKQSISQISTGGGAMLSLLERGDQPGLRHLPEQ